MSVYYVRHGQTDWNKKGLLQGQSDIALNEEGIRQAYIVKEQLKHIRIERIICSPLTRAKQTAEIINQNWCLHIKEDNRLAERNFAKMEGCHRSSFCFDDFWIFDQENIYEMETLECFFNRIYAFLDELSKEPEKNILLVAHGGVSIPFACYFDEENRKKKLPDLILKNCEVMKKDFLRIKQ